MIEKLNRAAIYLLRKHSNWSEAGIANALQRDVYANADAWQRFLRLIFISLGVGLSVLGVLFFFAYNWHDLHKFAKIGLVQVGLVAMIAAVLLPKMSDLVKNVTLMGASALVGVLFAVFGQVYQTGANAYDFFLGWTIFVTVWVVVADFPPLWLAYIALINTTADLYIEQVAATMLPNTVCILFILLNLTLLLAVFGRNKYAKNAPILPNWFSNTLSFAIVGIATVGISANIVEEIKPNFWFLTVLTFTIFAAGIAYAIRQKQVFYFALLPLSLIIIGSCYLIKMSDGMAMWLFLSVFIIISVSLVIKNILHLQKKWNYATEN